MVKPRTLPTFRVHYLTYKSKLITSSFMMAIANTNVTTGNLTVTTISDPITLVEQKELAINVTVQSISGTTPTLDVYLDVLDPIESQNKNVYSFANNPVVSVKLDPTQITTTPVNLRAIIANGQLVVWEGNTATNLGAFNVPMKWQVRFVIGGTSPSYGIIATYEARQ